MKKMFTVFNSPRNYYLFDGNNNITLSINEKEHDDLKKILSGENKENESLKKYQNLGYCLPSTIKKIEHIETEYLESYQNNRLESMALQVTQNCNLRCEYCPYSGSYQGRVHTKKRMSFSTAKKAIDFFIMHSKNTFEINLGFYGGEPLLEIKLIEKILAYINKSYPDKKFSYSITTNGTLITDEIIRFFEKNEIRMTLSLDGPEEIHDIHRKFINGQGSYKIIMDKLKNIKEKFPEYYKTVLINSVLTPDYDMGCINDFYDTESTIQLLEVARSNLSDSYTENKVIYGEKIHIIQEKEMFKNLLYMIDEVERTNVTKAIQSEGNSLINKNRFLQPSSTIAKGHPSGPCIPGVNRLFCNVEEKLYVCEKVSEESETVCIGTLDEGFNLEKSKNILNIGQITEEECKNCFAFRHCTQCVVTCDTVDRGFIAEKRLEKCSSVKYQLLNDLKDIVFLKENKFDFYKELN